MKKPRFLILFCVVVLAFVTACGALNTLTGGSKSAGTVSDLWSDVPKMDGLSKTDLEIPLAMNLGIKAYLKTLGQEGAKIDYIAFTTAKTPQDVQTFYDTQRMTAAGWSDDQTPGCTSDTGVAGFGAMCIYGKKSDGTDSFIMIVTAQDDSTKQTSIFFVRLDATGTPTPAASGFMRALPLG